MPADFDFVIPAKAGVHRQAPGQGSLDPRFRAGLSGEVRDGCGTECAMALLQLRVVTAGLDPAIQAPATRAGDAGNRVDTRVKPAHDDLRLAPLKTRQPISVPRTALRFRGGDGAAEAGRGRCRS